MNYEKGMHIISGLEHLIPPLSHSDAPGLEHLLAASGPPELPCPLPQLLAITQKVAAVRVGPKARMAQRRASGDPQWSIRKA